MFHLPVEHVVRDEFDVRGPVLLVEYILEVGSGQDGASVVARPRPWVECTSLELWHVPWLARVDFCVVLVVVGRNGDPSLRVGAVKELRVSILRSYISKRSPVNHEYHSDAPDRKCRLLQYH